MTSPCGVDDYSSEDPYQGINDTLNTVAFGLSTGKGAAVPLRTADSFAAPASSLLWDADDSRSSGTDDDDEEVAGLDLLETV